MATARALADEALDLLAQEDPLADFLDGHPGTEGRLPPLDEATCGQLRDRALAVVATAQSRAAIDDDPITAAVAAQQAQAVASRIDARLVDHTMVGYDHSPIGRLLGALPLVGAEGPAGEEQYLARLAAIPDYLEQATERHRRAIAGGRLPVADRVQAAVDRLDRYLGDEAGDPLRKPDASRASLAKCDQLLADSVRPAFARYRRVLHEELLHHGRSPAQPGLCWLPGGHEIYRSLVAVHTTTDDDPAALHDLGCALLDELDGEYEAAGGVVFDVSTAADVRERMRADDAPRWSGPDVMRDAARDAVDRAQRMAPAWFATLPSAPCTISWVPEIERDSAPPAYYVPPSRDGARPGTFYLNPDGASDRTTFALEATAFHEGVPGHHYQFAIAAAAPDVPELRRVAWVNAYIEGWGLYAERLADEMGLYSDDQARLGLLAMDSLRAARLVVDTGLHAYGWTRGEAVAFLRQHTLLGDAEAERETDRYIEFPGQALSYMVGRRVITELRQRARTRLGPAFDLRRFHDVVLGSGPLPLGVLGMLVDGWIAEGGG